MGQFIVIATCVLALIGVSAYIVYAFVDVARTKASLKRKIAGLADDGSSNAAKEDEKKSKKKKKKDKDKGKNKDKSEGAPSSTDAYMISWFSRFYPVLAGRRHEGAFGQANEIFNSAIAYVKDEASARALNSYLPRRYRDALHDISDRMTQIRKRTDDESIGAILDSYCESIESSTLSYVELASAPVKSESMVETMDKIEDTVCDVTGALDAILASTYERNSMKAQVEADTLAAVIKHNRQLFGVDGDAISPGDTVFVDEEVAGVEIKS